MSTGHEDPVAFLALLDTAERYQQESRAARRRYRLFRIGVLTVGVMFLSLSVVVLMVSERSTSETAVGTTSVALSAAVAVVALLQTLRLEQEDITSARRVSDFAGRYLRESAASRVVEKEWGPAWSADLRARLLGIDVGRTGLKGRGEIFGFPNGVDVAYGYDSLRLSLRRFRESRDVVSISVVVRPGNLSSEQIYEDVAFLGINSRVQVRYLIIDPGRRIRDLWRHSPSLPHPLQGLEVKVGTADTFTNLYLCEFKSHRADDVDAAGALTFEETDADSSRPAASLSLIFDSRENPDLRTLSDSLRKEFDVVWERATAVSSGESLPTSD